MESHFIQELWRNKPGKKEGKKQDSETLKLQGQSHTWQELVLALFNRTFHRSPLNMSNGHDHHLKEPFSPLVGERDDCMSSIVFNI